jgi:hypothetical protein
MKLKSQNERILDYLKQGRPITAIEALRMFDCFRLAARVKDLKDQGHNIKSYIINVGEKKIAAYLLHEKKQ